MRSAIWRVNGENLELQSLLPTQQHGHSIKQTLFHTTDANKALTVVDNHFIVWDIAQGEAKVSEILLAYKQSGSNCQIIV